MPKTRKLCSAARNPMHPPGRRIPAPHTEVLGMPLPGLEQLPATRRIFCVGRNYADHAKEMGSALPPEPVIFMKPATSLVQEGVPLKLPRGRGAVHHEME